MFLVVGIIIMFVFVVVIKNAARTAVAVVAAFECW